MWILRLQVMRQITFSLLLFVGNAACASESSPPTVNRPLAQAEVKMDVFDGANIHNIVRMFARKNHFALEEHVDPPQGNVEYHVRLFRDDITAFVSKIRGEPISVTALPLCVSELGERTGLRVAAEAAVRELSEDLSD